MLANEGIYLSARIEHNAYWSDLLSLVNGFEVVVDASQIGKSQWQDRIVQIRRTHPLIVHSLDLSIGTAKDVRSDRTAYIKSLAQVIQENSIGLLSDHLSYSQANYTEVPNFIPLQCNEQMLEVLTGNIQKLKQDLTVPQLAFENICYYFNWFSESESQFIARLLQHTDTYLLLDLNNLYINSVNHKFDPYVWLKDIPPDRIAAIHVAGHESQKGLLLDSHNQPVSVEVLNLLSYTLKHTPVSRVVLEWDSQFSEASIKQQLKVLQTIWKHARN